MSLPTLAHIKHEQYKFYEDAGHGWLRVPITELIELNIQNEITSFSYIDDEYVYLEEDQDADIYVNKRFPSEYERKLFYQMCENIYHEDSWIRNLKRYYPEEPETDYDRITKAIS